SLQALGATHAKTSKQLDIAMSDTEPEGPRIFLTLQYLDPILGDTGESAYRDAILDYISGRAEAMKIVPNRSFAAVATLVGGVLACLSLVVLKAVQFHHAREPSLVLGITYILVGLLALLGIARKPGQATGANFAIGGILA